MSGGCLDYAYLKISNIKEDIKDNINDNYNHLLGHSENEISDFNEKIKSLYESLDILENDLKNLEWFLSGDSSINDFIKNNYEK